MSSMDLSLADGWTQVEPKETRFEILMSGQGPEQRLISWDTAFQSSRELGISSGLNCPLAVDQSGQRVFVSVDGIVSYGLYENTGIDPTVSDVSAVWMLAYNSAGPELVMHVQGDEPMHSFIARHTLDTGKTEKQPLPEEAFVPLALSSACDKVLYSRNKGSAAVYDLTKEVSTLASLKIPFWVTGGAFDVDERRVILGGDGLSAWDTVDGSTSLLCKYGTHPVIDGGGNVWFSSKDGALAKLNSKDTSFETIVELSALDTGAGRGGSYAQPCVLSPDSRYGFVVLTGREKLVGRALEDAEAFCKSVGQPFSEMHQYRYEHYRCVLDIELQEVWCREGYADNVAWVLSIDSSR